MDTRFPGATLDLTGTGGVTLDLTRTGGATLDSTVPATLTQTAAFWPSGR